MNRYVYCFTCKRYTYPGSCGHMVDNFSLRGGCRLSASASRLVKKSPALGPGLSTWAPGFNHLGSLNDGTLSAVRTDMLSADTIQVDSRTYFRTLVEDANHWAEADKTYAEEVAKLYDLCPPTVGPWAGFVTEAYMVQLGHWDC